jgi:hypothetical protein
LRRSTAIFRGSCKHNFVKKALQIISYNFEIVLHVSDLKINVCLVWVTNSQHPEPAVRIVTKNGIAVAGDFVAIRLGS